MANVGFDSPYYPYEKVRTGANTLKGAELIPYKILMYLLDLADDNGYTPPDNNNYPRCRLKKYLWYDGANPLDQELPTDAQMKSLLFDPRHPDINSDAGQAAHPKGYRLFMQRAIGQAQLEAQTLLKCYVGRIFESPLYYTVIGLNFEVWTNVNFATNTKSRAYDRSFDIEQCLHEALDGVNIAGIGTISFARQDHSYNGSEIIYDEVTGLGRLVNCSIAWSEGGGEKIADYQNTV